MPSMSKVLDNVTAFLLRNVVRYRNNVIRKNLQSSFEYTSDADLTSDVKGNYLFLARIIRQVLIKPTPKLLGNRLTFKHLPQVDAWLRDGKSVIITMGHVGNWEWAGMFIGIQYPGKVCALYRRIKSEKINRLMLNRRRIMRGFLIESGRIGDLIKLIRTQPVLILMIADQNPGNDQGIIWTNFLKKNTAFVSGPESLAQKYQLPVVYLRNMPNDQDGYDLEFEVLSNGADILPPGEITRRYAASLEKNILMRRTQWLWSHKRWKRTPEISYGQNS